MPAATPAHKPVSLLVEPKASVDPGTCVSVSDPRAHRSLGAAVLELGKPRITRLVTLTAAVGFVLRSSMGGSARPEWTTFITTATGCLVGTALCSAGANALNQWWEHRRDSRMRRTMNRPIPTGELSAALGLWAGLLMSLAGTLVLGIFSGAAATTVAVATILIYVLIYTPLKVITAWNTAVGAVPGALPPLIGWCAAAAMFEPSQELEPLAEAGGWSLFAMMAVWQIPHFLALAWMYRDDYAAGGYRMLPSIDGTGKLTAWLSLAGSVVLLGTTLGPWASIDVLGWPYAVVAVVSSIGFSWLCATMVLDRGKGEEKTRAAARRVFLASIVHLPLLLVAMTAESLARVIL